MWRAHCRLPTNCPLPVVHSWRIGYFAGVLLVAAMSKKRLAGLLFIFITLLLDVLGIGLIIP